MTKLFLIRFWALIVLISITTSCKPSIKRLVNENFEPITVKDQQLQSLDDNLKNVDSLKPNIGVRISTSMIKEFLPKEIETRVKKITDSKFKVHQFSPSIDLVDQAIVLNADFSISLNEIETKITGSLQGYVAISPVQDSIFFLPAFKSIKAKKIEFTSEKPSLTNKAIAALIKPVTKHFLDNINGHFFKKTPSLYSGWGKSTEINTSELFSNNETVISGPKVEISRYIKKNALLIDKSGISIMLELEKSKQEQDSSSTFVYQKTSSLKDLNQSYEKYYVKYVELWVSNFKAYNDSTKLAVSITKSTMAGIFNDGLSSSVLDISHIITIPKISKTDELEIDRLKLDCNSVRERFSFPDFSYPHSCSHSCMKKIKIDLGFFKTTKRIEDPICAAARSACKVARETARIAWQTSRESARIAHQVYNEGRVAACKIATEASELIDFGKLKTSSEANGVARLNLKNIIMSNDLSVMHLNLEGSVMLELKSYLGLRPQDIGHLVMCTVDYDKSITTELTGNILNQFSQISFNPEKVGDNIILTGRVTPIGYKATADMSPLHELLIDPLLATKCSLLYSTLLAGGSVGGVAAILGMVDDPKLQLLLKGTAIGTYKLEPFTQKITPIIFRINNGKDRKANVEWGENSIDYSY